MDYEKFSEQFGDLLDTKAGEESDIRNWEQVKHRIMLRVVNREWSRNRLENLSFVPFLNLAVIFYAIIDDGSGKRMEREVTKELSGIWKMNPDELLSVAVENTRRVYPIKIFDFSLLSAVCFGKTGARAEGVYCLTNQGSMDGAAVLLYREDLRALGEKLESDFYIVPVNNDELLVFAADKGHTAKELKEVLKYVNGQTERYQNQLSDEIYLYRRGSGEITVVETE